MTTTLQAFKDLKNMDVSYLAYIDNINQIANVLHTQKHRLDGITKDTAQVTADGFWKTVRPNDDIFTEEYMGMRKRLFLHIADLKWNKNRLVYELASDNCWWDVPLKGNENKAYKSRLNHIEKVTDAKSFHEATQMDKKAVASSKMKVIKEKLIGINW